MSSFKHPSSPLNQRSFEVKLKEQQIKFEEQRVVDHAKATQDIFEEVQAILTAKYGHEEKIKLRKIRQSLADQYKAELNKKEVQFGAELAKERQAVSKANLLNAQLEIKMQALGEQMLAERTDKENLQKIQN